MKPFRSLCFLFVLIAIGAFAKSPIPVSTKIPSHIRILLLGDSTTIGSVPRRLDPKFPTLEAIIEKGLAAQRGMPSAEVINSGRDGEFIRRLLDSGRYDKEVANLKGLDYIFIRYGLNDRNRIENFPENFPKDFKELIGRLQKDHPKAVLIITSVIPFSNAEGSKIMNDLIRRVASSEDLLYFDLYRPYDAELKSDKNRLNYRRVLLENVPESLREQAKPYTHGEPPYVEVMDDSMDAVFGQVPGWTSDRHPNPEGYRVIGEATVTYLVELLKKGGRAK